MIRLEIFLHHNIRSFFLMYNNSIHSYKYCKEWNETWRRMINIEQKHSVCLLGTNQIYFFSRMWKMSLNLSYSLSNVHQRQPFFNKCKVSNCCSINTAVNFMSFTREIQEKILYVLQSIDFFLAWLKNNEIIMEDSFGSYILHLSRR